MSQSSKVRFFTVSYEALNSKPKLPSLGLTVLPHDSVSAPEWADRVNPTGQRRNNQLVYHQRMGNVCPTPLE